MPTIWFVDFTAGTNGPGSTFSPFNNVASMRSAGAVGGDTFFCVGPLNGPMDLGTMAGSSLAKPINIIGVTNVFTLDQSARTVINASGSSYALTGSGSNLRFENMEFKNSSGQEDQSSGSNVHFEGCVFSKGTGSATTVWSGYDRFYRGCKFFDFSGTVLTLAGTYGAVVEDCEFVNVGKAVDSYGYRNITIRGNAIASATSDGITLVDNATSGTTYEVVNNSFGTIGGSALVFGGNGNGDIMAQGNVFGAVTGTGIKITAGSPSGTVIGAARNRFWTVGTNLGANVNDLGINTLLGSNPFTNAASNLTPASGSAIINAGYNGGSIGGMQAAAGGGSSGVPTIKGARPTMDVSLSETHIFDFITEDATGAAADATGTPTCQVFDNATDTPLLTPTVTKRTSQTGNYRVSVAFTSGNGFTVGNSYNLIATAVIGGVTKKFNLAKVIVRTGNVDSVNATKVAGDATSATNLKNALNGTGGVTITAGLTGNVTGNLSGSVGSVTGAVGSVTGAVGSVTGGVGGNLSGNVLGSVSGSVGSVTGSVGSVTGAVGSVTGSVGGSVASVVGAVGSVAGSVAGDVGGKVLGGGSGTITGDGVRASSVTGATGSVTGSVGSVLGSVGSVTGAVGSVTTTSNIATAVRDISNSSPVAGSLGDKVNSAASAGDPWATVLPGSYGINTAGNIVGNRLDAAITSRSTFSGGAVASVTGSVGSVVGAVGSVTGAVGSVSSVSNIATAVRDVSNASPVAGSLGDKVNNAASAGDPWATVLPGAYGSNTAGNILGNRLDVAVGTRSTFAGGAVASVTGSVGSVTGSVGSVVGSVGGNVSGSVASVAGNVAGSVASVAGNVSGSVASVTGNVGGSVASVVGSVGSVVGSVGSVLSGVNLASTGLDSVFPETGINAKQTLSTILASVAGQLAGATTNTVVLRNPSGSAIRITATTDPDGNRTSIVLNLAA